MKGCFPISNLGDDDINIDNSISICDEVIDELILYYAQLNKKVIGTDFSVRVYSSTQRFLQTEDSIAIDISECLTDLKTTNNIPLEDNLIIAKFEQPIINTNTIKYKM